ncbi:amino acid permease C-terminal domain-containing protein, partial [Clavibacter michiganensis]|uniref:amino acid permease C-terminal domain-containing protein n=1 Tax=Clavibacter michiganensis TaxID=28447 RepID=UPI00293020B7
VPFSPVLPIVSAAICAYLMLNLSVETWLRFLVWLALGFAIYFAYSRRHARVGMQDFMPRVVSPPKD